MGEYLQKASSASHFDRASLKTDVLLESHLTTARKYHKPFALR